MEAVSLPLCEAHPGERVPAPSASRKGRVAHFAPDCLRCPRAPGNFLLCQLFKCQTAQDSSSCAYISPCPLHTPGQTFWCPLNDQQQHRDTSSPQLNSSTTCCSTHQRFTSPPPSVTQPVTQSRTLYGTLTPPCIWQQPKPDWFCSPGLPAADVFRPPTRSSNCFPSPSSFQ